MNKEVSVDVMKAFRIHEYGGPEQLQYEDVPVPEPKTGQVLVRVHAASINPIDYKLASGTMRQFMPLNFPWTPGGDFSGVIEAVGPDVTDVKKGDAVYGNTPHGGSYAQFVVASANLIAPKPAKLSDVEAASVPLAAQTAWQGLFDNGHLEAGQTVLIHGAAGGVGTYAVQFAHWKGAKVLVTSSTANVGYLQSLGADQVIDYKTTPFESVAKNIDLVFDLIGGETQERSFQVLKSGGYLVSSTQSPSEEKTKKYNVHGLRMGMQASKKNLMKISELLDAGKIKPVITKTYPVAQAKDAWAEHLSGHTRGKVVLTL